MNTASHTPSGVVILTLVSTRSGNQLPAGRNVGRNVAATTAPTDRATKSRRAMLPVYIQSACSFSGCFIVTPLAKVVAGEIAQVECIRPATVHPTSPVGAGRDRPMPVAHRMLRRRAAGAVREPQVALSGNGPQTDAEDGGAYVTPASGATTRLSTGITLGSCPVTVRNRRRSACDITSVAVLISGCACTFAARHTSSSISTATSCRG